MFCSRNSEPSVRWLIGDGITIHHRGSDYQHKTARNSDIICNMSLFGLGHPSDRYGVIIDIGSGSVLAAIVHSVHGNKTPNIVWSHREHAPLRNIDSLEQSSKAVMTALMNVSMLLDGEGRRALYEYSPTAKLTEVQCGISAPWSYTVTKTVNYRQENSFEITHELIEDIEHTIEERIIQDLQENDVLQDLGLQIITQATTGITANGYRVADPEGQQAKELSISHTSAVSQQYLLDAIKETHDKLFPQTKLHNTSFIFIFFNVIEEFLSPARDICLIDVTFEATEIGIVRDEVLMYATHTPYGSFSLARELAATTNIPLHEAFFHLHSDTLNSFKERLNKQQSDEVELIFDSYVSKLAELFQQTGDALSIPKRILLHCNVRSESLYRDLVEKAAKRSIKAKPVIRQVTSEMIRKMHVEEGKTFEQASGIDSALVLSAQFFHMRRESGENPPEYF